MKTLRELSAITINKYKQIMITVNIQGWEKRDELWGELALLPIRL